MATDLKFEGAMMIFGSVVCFFIFIYLLRLFFVEKEMFEDLKGDATAVKPASCKPLSPAAQAAADAADAATNQAADAAAKAVGVTPGVTDPYVSATPSVFSVTCPSGDPIVAFGATKPPSLDSQLGKFGGPGVKRRVYKKADFSEEDAEDEGLEGADPKNECHTADSQPADVDSSCSIKPVRPPCGKNGYAFDPETEY